jgi:hypothetical protein
MPFNKTAELAELRIHLTQLIHFEGKPLCFITSTIKGCSILSNAFSKSSLRMTTFFWSGDRYVEIRMPKQGSLV